MTVASSPAYPRDQSAGPTSRGCSLCLNTFFFLYTRIDFDLKPPDFARYFFSLFPCRRRTLDTPWTQVDPVSRCRGHALSPADGALVEVIRHSYLLELPGESSKILGLRIAIRQPEDLPRRVGRRRGEATARARRHARARTPDRHLPPRSSRRQTTRKCGARRRVRGTQPRSSTCEAEMPPASSIGVTPRRAACRGRALQSARRRHGNGKRWATLAAGPSQPAGADAPKHRSVIPEPISLL